MESDELLELREDFEYEIEKRMIIWQGIGVDTRGIKSGLDALSVKKVCGWISAPKSRSKFERVMAELGERDTVEVVVVDPKFLPLTRQWHAARMKAQGRLDGSVSD